MIFDILQKLYLILVPKKIQDFFVGGQAGMLDEDGNMGD